MRRRALLASLGALPAGCAELSPPGTSDTPSPSTTANPCEWETDTPAAPAAGGTETDGEYRLTDLAVATSTDRPSVRYVLDASAFYSGDAVEREAERTGEEQIVRDVSAVEDDEVRAAIEAAIRDGDWRSNTLPDGLAETVDRVDFFTGASEDSTYTHVGLTLYRLEPDRPPAVEFGATIVDDVVSTASPGAVEFELRNGSRTTQEVFSGTVPPFGMVFADAVDDPERFLLWREYEAEGCIEFGEDGWLRCDIGIYTELQPCERITRRYEILPSGTSQHPEYTAPPGPGTYRITDSLRYNGEHGAPESELSFEVEFGLESL